MYALHVLRRRALWPYTLNARSEVARVPVQITAIPEGGDPQVADRRGRDVVTDDPQAFVRGVTLGEVIEGLREVQDRGEPSFGLLRQAARDDALELLGHVGSDAADHRRCRGEMRLHDPDRAVAGEGHVAREHLEEDDPDLIDVAAPVNLCGHDLLGAHVFRRAEGHAGRGRRELAGIGRVELGDAEVDQLHEVAVPLIVDDEDVRGLDVAVEDASRVSRREALAELPGDEGGPERLDGPLLVDELGDRSPVQTLHRDKGDALLGGAIVEDPHNVLVQERADHAALLHEPREGIHALSEVALEDLDRRELPRGDVMGIEDRRHAPRRDETFEAPGADLGFQQGFHTGRDGSWAERDLQPA